MRTDRADDPLFENSHVKAWARFRGWLASAQVVLTELMMIEALNLCREDRAQALRSKSKSISVAVYAWHHMDKQVRSGTMTMLAAWDAFADQIRLNLDAPDQHEGFYEGVAMVLDAQCDADPCKEAGGRSRRRLPIVGGTSDEDGASHVFGAPLTAHLT